MKIFSRGTMLLSSLAVVLSLSTPAVAADDKKPELRTGASAVMLADACSGCHGQDGASTGPAIPTIAGGASTYFVDVMEGYKSGDIPSTIMGRIAKGYTSEEIKLMGDFYEKKEYVAATGQKSDAALAKKGAKIHKKYCEKCHSEEGTLAEDESGFLTGQWKPYLAAQLMDYQSKEREASKKMAKKFKKMYKKHGDDGIKALLEFYSK